MKNATYKSPPTFVQRAIWTMTLMSVFILLGSTHALANTAAGTAISNTATVSYDEGGDVSSSVTVTVNLVGGLAWNTPPAGQATSSATDLTSAYSIDLMNTGNGSDQVDISDGTTQVTPANLTVGSFTVTPNTDVILGGTVSDAAATYDGVADETTITVGNLIPADFANGDTVRIGGVFTGTEYTVVSSSATQLVLSGDATGEITGAGIQIGEVISVSYDGTAGTLQNSSPTEIHRHELTATTDLPTGGTATSGTWDTTVNGGSISVTKYVRNIDTPNGTAPAVSINVGGTTSDYFITGVTGDPGEILEYVVVIENTGAGNASNVVMTDTLSGFLNLTNTSIRVDIDDDNTFDADTSSSDADTATPPETVSAGDGIVVVTGSTLTVYAGSAGTDVAPAAGGTLPSSTTSEVSYRATIQ